MNKIKVCHIITKLELGGAQKNTIYTMENLDGERYEAFLITGSGGFLDSEVRSRNFRTYFIPDLVREINPARDIKSIIEIIGILKTEKPDIVHTHSSKAGILGRWAAFFARVKIIIHTYHGFGFNDRQNVFIRYFYIFIELLSSLITDYFILVSNDNIKTARGKKIIRKDNGILINSGIEKEKIMRGTGKLRKELNLQENALLVGMISCLKPQKAPLDFVEIAHKIHKMLKNTYFFIAGEGILRKEIEAKVLAYDLSGIFYLLGDRADIEEVLTSVDILVLTSLWEGLPRAVLESKVPGLPIVASAVNGTKEAIKDGVDGFLVKPRDINSFANKIYLLANDVNLRKKISENSRKSFKPEYDIKNMVEKIDKLYCDLFKKYIRTEPEEFLFKEDN